MLVWADVDWSGDAMTCKSTSAGALQLENHGIEAWTQTRLDVRAFGSSTGLPVSAVASRRAEGRHARDVHKRTRSRRDQLASAKWQDGEAYASNSLSFSMFYSVVFLYRSLAAKWRCVV